MFLFFLYNRFYFFLYNRFWSTFHNLLTTFNFKVMFWTSIFVKLHKNLSHLPLWKIYWIDFHKHSSYHRKFNFFAKIKLKINCNYIIFFYDLLIWSGAVRWDPMRKNVQNCFLVFLQILQSILWFTFCWKYVKMNFLTPVNMKI